MFFKVIMYLGYWAFLTTHKSFDWNECLLPDPNLIFWSLLCTKVWFETAVAHTDVELPLLMVWKKHFLSLCLGKDKKVTKLPWLFFSIKHWPFLCGYLYSWSVVQVSAIYLKVESKLSHVSIYQRKSESKVWKTGVVFALLTLSNSYFNLQSDYLWCLSGFLDKYGHDQDFFFCNDFLPSTFLCFSLPINKSVVIMLLLGCEYDLGPQLMQEL